MSTTPARRALLLVTAASALTTAACSGADGAVSTDRQDPADHPDGTYTATGWYDDGAASLEVTVTLAADAITAVDVTPTATDPAVLDEQVRFAEDIGQIVLGVDIDTVEVGWVAGSSATPRGFNDALRQIKEQATDVG
ncbi:hypothetical protein [Cellulomonas soli]|uniref:FMN-binding domain-containing protein n=1 Tax=Cellulomonas soli TaxID=931535 RepID=A0A512P8G7_9CELL|nr:hypothetical protein [Cellulomonas soli]NYI57717.1 uncharacterized protein with FMN-binding domain [Cellulomonas soli]GEP67498.1 hypothetical protein CSO01_02130 [Cellulomonas soli]